MHVCAKKVWRPVQTGGVVSGCCCEYQTCIQWCARSRVPFRQPRLLSATITNMRRIPCGLDTVLGDFHCMIFFCDGRLYESHHACPSQSHRLQPDPRRKAQLCCTVAGGSALHLEPYWTRWGQRQRRSDCQNTTLCPWLTGVSNAVHDKGSWPDRLWQFIAPCNLLPSIKAIVSFFCLQNKLQINYALFATVFRYMPQLAMESLVRCTVSRLR